LSEIVERFDRMRRDSPDRLVIHLPAAGVSLTVQDIWNASLLQRARFEALGLGEEHLVISAAGNRPSAVSLWLACRSLGIALMPVEAGTPTAEIRTLARRFGATIAILAASTPALEALGTATPFERPLVAVRLADTIPAPQIYRGAAALKVTSGSTGVPKATFTREAQLVEDAAHVTTAMNIGPQDCQIAAIPLSHSYGLGNLVMPLLLQGTPVVLREAFIPQQLHADATTYHARVFPGVPYMFGHFAHNPDAIAWPRVLESLVSAGAPLDPIMANTFAGTFGVKIHSFYGTSESGGISFDDSPDVETSATVGRPLPGVTITLRPHEGAPIDGGRVHVAGGAVSSGYAGQAATDEAFTDGGFLTGDFGRFDARQRLILTGRASSFINVAGKKVQPEEVEEVLRSMRGIDDVRVLGVADAVRGQQVVACVVTQRDGMTAPEIRQFCAARLAAHKIPRTVVWLERIPLTERGKTDRATLEAFVREHLDWTAESGVL
jgi:acyl-CoA synthetase (AMP-forming)/AMP-acid ligase II